MPKAFYDVVNEKPQTTSQVNPTYNGKEIPTEITTTGGVYVHYEQCLKNI
jgi:hypothetical protein